MRIGLSVPNRSHLVLLKFIQNESGDAIQLMLGRSNKYPQWKTICSVLTNSGRPV